jgi:hypothetical protein
MGLGGIEEKPGDDGFALEVCMAGEMRQHTVCVHQLQAQLRNDTGLPLKEGGRQ